METVEADQDKGTNQNHHRHHHCATRSAQDNQKEATLSQGGFVTSRFNQWLKEQIFRLFDVLVEMDTRCSNSRRY